MEVPLPAWRVHPGEGPYALLIHGFLSSSVQWLDNLDALGRICRPVTMDLWGHGASPAPTSSEAYSPAGYLRAVEAIRVELGAERWFLCGYSMGAGITLRYALTWPERVIGQVFTNSTSALADEAQLSAWRENAGRVADNIRAGGRAAVEAVPVHPRHATHLPEHLYRAITKDAERLDPLGVANSMQYTNPYISVRDDLHRNTVPTLLVCGANETRFAPLRSFAAEHMPDLTIVDLDAGHAVNMEAADAFNEAVTAFFQGLG